MPFTKKVVPNRDPKWDIVPSLKAFYTLKSTYLASKPTHLWSKRRLLKSEVESKRLRKKGFSKSIYELKGTYREIEKEHLELLLERLEI